MSSLFLLPLLLVIGFGIGALATWLALRVFGGHAGGVLRAEQAEARAEEQAARAAAQLEELAAVRREQAALRDAAEAARLAHARIEADLAAARVRHAELEVEAARSIQEHKALRQELGEAREQCVKAGTALEGERAAAAEKLALLVGAREELTNQFKSLANEILEEKSKRFTDHNRTSMDQLLTPLRDKLGEFQLKVEGLHQDGLVGRTELRTHIEALRNMNEKLSVDANNLVKALKGSSKTQGDWGEVLLIGILEDAGLRSGKEYRVQESFATENGRHVRPDIILDLPKDKHLVIDSKVSLTSYAEYCACDDDESRKGFLERHTRSMRDHIDGLSKKAYQGLHQLQSLDFVIMFVPIEPAYLLALAHDSGLWQRAWNKDVLLVSPSTLYPILRTIQYAWQQERQTRNVEEIVRQGGALYDKVAVFASCFEDVGKKLTGAQTAYEKAYGQLAQGRGNILSRIEDMRQKGLKTSKIMPAGLANAEPEEAFVPDALETRLFFE